MVVVTARLSTVVIDAIDIEKLAGFWASVLGWTAQRDADGDVAVFDPTGQETLSLLVIAVPERKAVKNRLHIDLRPVGTDQEQELERLLRLGARRVDIGQGEPTWVVLADPEGNEFCLLENLPDDPAPR
jgi:predicted enzyme related to lactoylglutathione lyase